MLPHPQVMQASVFIKVNRWLQGLKSIFTHFVVFLLILTISSRVTAQEVIDCDEIISSYCDRNLSNEISGIKIDSTGFISYGISYPTLKDVLYEKDSMKCDPDYDKGDKCVSSDAALNFYVYYPDSIDDVPLTCKLPVIINFHGGSYFECSRSTHEGARDICRRLAKRGFIVINAEYRRGVLLDANQFGPNFTQKISVQQILAIYRANQDARGCIRSVIRMQRMNDAPFGDLFTIDTTRIFIAGQSAGAVMAMGAAYYERQGQIDSALSSGNSNLHTLLGSLDAPFYYGEASKDYKPLLKGVLAMWGGLPVHKSFLNNSDGYFSTNTVNPPLIGFVGKNDLTFPPGNNYFYFSTRTHAGINYKTSSFCLVGIGSFSNPDDIIDPDPTVNADAVCIGIDSLHASFKRLGKYSEDYIDCQMGHGLDTDCVSCTYQSEFGTGAPNQTTVINYIAGRSATYFTGIMNSILSGVTRTRFVECTNTRKKCDVPGTTNTGCLYLETDEDDQNCDP